MDNDDLMESLPSESQFLSRAKDTVQHSKDFSPISAAEYINASTPDGDGDGGGIERETPRSNDIGGTPGSARSNSTSGTPGKKPFLRKGSRREPSALNRIQARA